MNNQALRESLCWIVPESIYIATGLTSDAWIDKIAGTDSRFADVEAEVCADYRAMVKAKDTLIMEQPTQWTTKVGQLERRMKTIAGERTLNFLSRKAVIPKYGFPVDVVELDTQSP